MGTAVTTPSGQVVQLPSIVGSFEQVVAALGYAGWPEAQWTTAAAVVAAESSRDLTVVNSIGCYGWFQIRKSAHPELFTALSSALMWIEPVTAAQMGYKVWQQAGGSWSPWQAYTTGAYRMYEGAAAAAVATVQAAANQADFTNTSTGAKAAYGVYLKPLEEKVAPYLDAAGLAAALNSTQATLGTAVTGVGSGFTDIGIGLKTLSWSDSLANFLQDLGKTGTWVSVAYVIGGALVLLLVLFNMLKGSQAAQTAAAVATKVII
jgi:hypothetical protein